MKWLEEYATGVERLDEQHRMLFQMAGDYRSSLDEGGGERVYASFLQSLDLYARSHFRLEEGCMERCRCPAAQANSQAHQEFVEVLRRFDARYTANGFERADARSLADTMDNWLVDHICRIDVQLKDWVERD